MELEAFGESISKLSSDVEQEARALKAQVAKSVAEEVIRATPIDTGKAASNWQANVNRPKLGVRQPFRQNDGEGSRAMAIALARAVFSPDRDGPFHLTNNADYISDLDNGKSRQAPPGFVGAAISKGVSKVNNG